ncbi:hypothetical protein [Hymenobacter glacieicola]|uniref:hypothetical protein n=1 Tax=Hymenobacter glacieicola TaxID=1562124 RepID=UPI0016699503|nr:hypothetical protein [Hymenobacter glacieicola]
MPYAAIPALPAEVVFQRFVLERLHQFPQLPQHFIWQVAVGEEQVQFFYKYLPWDTAFFGRAMARLHAVLFSSRVSLAQLTAAVQQFAQHLTKTRQQHCYCEVATADPLLLTALGRAGWATIETRLQYYHPLTQLPATRYAVRAATSADSNAVQRVGATNRNPFDRFHADPFFSPEEGDVFLGEYAAATVRGYADVVLVPAQEVVDSFLAVSYLTPDAHLLGLPLGRVLLTAVGSRNQGWHRQLLSETLWHLKERGSTWALLTTQATNRAVVHNCELLGFRLGGVTQIVSWQA